MKQNDEFIKPRDWICTSRRGIDSIDTYTLSVHLIEEHKIIRTGEKELMYYDGKCYKKIAEYDCKNLIKRHVPPELRTQKTINGVYYHLITEERIPFERFNSNEHIIVFNNGILLLHKEQLAPHIPKIYNTIVIPCDYKQGLTFDDCPTFNKFINELVNNDTALVTLIMEYIGAIISNVYGYRYKKMLILCGQGNTGKSVLRELVMKIVGKENCHSIDIKQLNQRFGPAQIIGKRMAGSGDMSVSHLNDIDIIKQLTGSDDLNADRKGIDAVSFKYRGLLWFNTNKLPIFSGDKGRHVYERFLIVPCNNIIAEEKRDSLLIEKLYEEREAIVSIAVQALNNSIKNGYKFTECKAIKDSRKHYELMNNNFMEFIETCCVLHEGTTPRSVFFRRYFLWCVEHGFVPEKRRDASAFLEEHYGIIARKTGGDMKYDLTVNYNE